MALDFTQAPNNRYLYFQYNDTLRDPEMFSDKSVRCCQPVDNSALTV